MPRAGISRQTGIRSKCRRCNNLDPRDHTNTVYPSDSSKTKNLSFLTLILDALDLARAITRSSNRPECKYCNVLAQALDAFFDGWRDFRGRLVVDIREKGTIRLGLDDEKYKGEKVEIYAISDAKSPWATLGSARRIPNDSGSDDTFDFARRCIQDCLTNPKHASCSQTHPPPNVGPRRLLDVGRAARPIRLVDTQGRIFQYVALSHCWGKGRVLKTTKSNWQRLSSHISFEALPPLFRDAVIITRQLGLRYLWIDSLCIIQDSNRDWETESSKMGTIYEGSHVTISATDSPDGNTGCLTDRRKPVKILFENSRGKEYVLGGRKVLEHHPDLENGTPAKLFGPLTKRSWTLQEHVLSTRILHYTSTELLFECKSSYRCECFPPRKIYPTTPSLIPKALAKKSTNHSAVWDAWQRIVEQYSDRSLTVPRDKLPAISGIASKIKDATGSLYLAGLWVDHLASDLLWSSTVSPSSQAGSFALDDYRAPSFSWASIDAPISYYTLDEDERAVFQATVRLTSSTISPVGLNALGTIQDGSIKLRGPCLSAYLASEQNATWKYTLLIKGTSAIQISPDCLLVEKTVKSMKDEDEQTVQRAQMDDELINFRTPVLCIGVAKYDSWTAGLVLGISTTDVNAWERLGTFTAGMEAFSSAESKELTIV